MWDWGNETSYIHDEMTTTKANPRMNAYGPVWAVDAAHGKYIAVNPNENSTFEIPIPTGTIRKRCGRASRRRKLAVQFLGQQIVHARRLPSSQRDVRHQGQTVEHVDGQPGRRA